MDDIDKKILKRLQENARVTISVLSSEISLSMPAISERLKKLEASGVIKLSLWTSNLWLWFI